MSCGRLPDDYMENYDPNKPVCDNQDDFNKAFRKAVKYNNKKANKKAQPWMIAYLVLWAIFLVWAVMLAMKVAPGPQRVMHLTFAFLFAPAYVLATYLGMLGQGKGMRRASPLANLGFR